MDVIQILEKYGASNKGRGNRSDARAEQRRNDEEEASSSSSDDDRNINSELLDPAAFSSEALLKIPIETVYCILFANHEIRGIYKKRQEIASRMVQCKYVSQVAWPQFVRISVEREKPKILETVMVVCRLLVMEYDSKANREESTFDFLGSTDESESHLRQLFQCLFSSIGSRVALLKKWDQALWQMPEYQADLFLFEHSIRFVTCALRCVDRAVVRQSLFSPSLDSPFLAALGLFMKYPYSAVAQRRSFIKMHDKYAQHMEPKDGCLRLDFGMNCESVAPSFAFLPLCVHAILISLVRKLEVLMFVESEMSKNETDKFAMDQFVEDSMVHLDSSIFAIMELVLELLRNPICRSNVQWFLLDISFMPQLYFLSTSIQAVRIPPSFYWKRSWESFQGAQTELELYLLGASLNGVSNQDFIPLALRSDNLAVPADMKVSYLRLELLQANAFQLHSKIDQSEDEGITTTKASLYSLFMKPLNRLGNSTQLLGIIGSLPRDLLEKLADGLFIGHHYNFLSLATRFISQGEHYERTYHLLLLASIASAVCTGAQGSTIFEAVFSSKTSAVRTEEHMNQRASLSLYPTEADVPSNIANSLCKEHVTGKRKREQERELDTSDDSSLSRIATRLKSYRLVQPRTALQACSERIAIPRIRVQYLSEREYIQAFFRLLRMEAGVSIGKDIQDAVGRMRPNPQGDFSGWARYACPIKEIRVESILHSRLDDPLSRPSGITAILKIDVSKHSLLAKVEWLALDPKSVVFIARVGFSSHEKGFDYTLEKLRGVTFEERVNADGTAIPRAQEADKSRSKEQEASTTNELHFRVDLDCSPLLHDIYGKRTMAKISQDAIRHDLESFLNSFQVCMRRPRKQDAILGELCTLQNILAKFQSHDSEPTSSLDVSSIFPPWMCSILLGLDDPARISYPQFHASSEERISFYDAFLDKNHLKSVYPGCKALTKISSSNTLVFASSANTIRAVPIKHEEEEQNDTWTPLRFDPNQIHFSSQQIGAVRNALSGGLCMLSGGPGTGKTQVAVQIMVSLLRNDPRHRIVVIARSGRSLKEVLGRIWQRMADSDPGCVIRLGADDDDSDEFLTSPDSGLAEHPALVMDLGISARLAALQAARSRCLMEAQLLADELGIPGDYAYSCEAALLLYNVHIVRRYLHVLNSTDTFADKMKLFPSYKGNAKDPTALDGFREWFGSTIKSLFSRIQSFRPLELLRRNLDLYDYLIYQRASIIGMTASHASRRREEFVQKRFSFQTLIMDEVSLMQEVDAVLPMTIQDDRDAHQLQRIVLLGDEHHSLPVARSDRLCKYGNIQQSLFHRLIRLGAPVQKLTVQARSRPCISRLFQACYPGELSDIRDAPGWDACNPGFLFESQIVDLSRTGEAVDESAPLPHFYQNVKEAEYIAAVYIYMILAGYKSEDVAILATYQGQVHLLQDVLKASLEQFCHRNECEDGSLRMPKSICGIDSFHSQQAEYVLLSFVRTKSAGYMADPSRVVNAMSRARLGLYMFSGAGSGLFQMSKPLTTVWDTMSHTTGPDQDSKETTGFLYLRPEETFDVPPSRNPWSHLAKATEKKALLESRQTVRISSLDHLNSVLDSMQQKRRTTETEGSKMNAQ